MTERVLLSVHQPYSIEAMLIMRQELGWSPVYWLCRPEQESELKHHFGESLITHSYLDATRGKPAPDFSKEIIFPFDPGLLDPKEEAVALSMLDRNDAFSQSMLLNERLEFLLEAVGYWIAVFTQTKATLIIFEETPHQAIDYALYLAANHVGLRCINPIRGLPDAGFLVSDRIYPTAKTRNCSLAKGVRPGTGALAFIDKMDVDYDTHLDTILWDHKDSVRDIMRQKSFLGLFYTLLLNLKPKFHLRHYLNNFIKFDNDQKSSRKSLKKSQMKYLDFIYYKMKTQLKKTILRFKYQKLSISEINVNEPYIYCSLQYQPEASTSPMAGRYVQQWLMVAQIARYLPSGWSLYVKEHPSQFSGEYARYGESFRSVAYYDKLRSYPNVNLVSLSVNSFDLIDNARAVAAPGGTVCFEAVARGKPVLNFGAGFFKGCPGMWQVTSELDVAKAIKEIVSGVKPDVEKVRKFAEQLDSSTYPGALGGPAQLARMGITVEQNARLHADCWRTVAAWPTDYEDP